MMKGAVVLLCIFGLVASKPQPPSKDARIVGGSDASDGQFPYMIYVRGLSAVGSISSCGGSIIHARWGLSSANCVANRVSVVVSGGSRLLSRPSFVLETSSYATAPQYIDAIQGISQPHDIGLIGFGQDLVFDDFVGPIRLQRSSDAQRDYTGVLMTTSGWGTTYDPGLYEIYEMNEELQWTHLTGVSNFMCLLMINSNYLVQETTICASPHSDPDQGICSGDSGVPLTMIDVDGAPTQVGVGSFVSSFGCIAPIPNGFVRPGFYLDWMRDVTGVNFDW